MSIRYAQPQNVCVICGIRTRGLPCPTCNVEKQYIKCIVNLVKPLDVNFIHVHPDQLVALYYVNITWNPEWGGETLFYKEDRKTISLASPYTPNKLIFFDGKIPHTIKAQNLIGPSYRFTLSIFFNKK